jgi:CRISPR-associated protein Csd1
MILQALNDYYHRKGADPATALAPVGWEVKEIPFVVVLSKHGKVVQFEDLREGEGRRKRAKPQLVPAAVKRSSGVAANLLWDSVEYALGIPARGNHQRTAEQHAAFKARLVETFGAEPTDPGLAAVMAFLAEAPSEDLLAPFEAWKEALEANAFISFRLERDSTLVCQRSSVRELVQSTAAGAPTGICLVTGHAGPVAELHPTIKGLRGGQPTGTSLISFNLPAFESLRKNQGANAPIGEVAARAYATALNHLLSHDSRQKLALADATVVFWAEKASGAPVERFFANWFDPPPDDPDAGTESVRALFEFRKGHPLTADDDQRFFVLGLSPNAARVAVRFWQVATVAEIGARIFDHFSDLEIVLPPKAMGHPSIYRLLCAIAPLEDIKRVPPSLAGDWMRAILAGVPYPATLLQAAVRRCRSEREVGPSRAALIKACLNRLQVEREEELSVSLDMTNPNTGYRLGRLFAVFEKIQEEASPGIDATIRDRYFGSASTSPMVSFPILNRLKNHHLAKLENRGRAVNFEKLIGEVMGGLDAASPFPPNLTLADQGRFAVGYYHQRQKFFEKTEGGE